MNNDVIVQKGSEQIAAEINGIKRTVRGVMLSAAMEIGRLLIEAKGIVPHGEWGAWLENNVDYSQTTANDMMRLYTEYGDRQISLDGGPSNEELFGALAPSKALALLALPEEDRREFVQTKPVEDMSVRQLREEIAQLKDEKTASEAARDILRGDVENLEAARQKAEQEKQAAEAKLKAEEKNRQAAIAAAEKAAAEKVKKKLDDITKKLKAAEERDAEKAKQIDALQTKLEEAESAAAEEKEPEDSEEVIALREEKARLEKQLIVADPTMTKFGVLLGQYQKQFSDMVDMVRGADNPEKRAKMLDVLTRVQASFTALLSEE